VTRRSRGLKNTALVATAGYSKFSAVLLAITGRQNALLAIPINWEKTPDMASLQTVVIEA